MTKKYDVIIVGGGLAGSACAHFCSNQGLKTLLIEKTDKLGGKACSEGAPLKIKDVIDLSKFALNNVHRAKIHLDGEMINNIESKRKIGIIFDRPGISKYFGETVEANGGNVLMQTKVTDIKNKTITTAKKEEFKGDYIVLADGVNSIHNHKKSQKNLSTFSALQYTFENCKVPESSTVQFWIKLDNLGLMWCFPRTKNSVHIGVCFEQQKLLKPELESFLRIFPWTKNCNTKILRGGQIPVSGMINQLIDKKNNTLICGEAAGQFLPLFGEGNRFAFQAAKFASEAIKENNLEIYPQKFKPVEDMIKQQKQLFDILMEATPKLRKDLFQKFSKEIFSRWRPTWKKYGYN